MKLRKLVCLALVVLLLAGLCGCKTYDNFKETFFDDDTDGTEFDETIKIGIFEPMTGPDAASAADEIRGIELAHDLFEMISGKPVELVYADNQSDVNAAATAAQSLIDAGVTMVLGSYGNVLTLAGMEFFTEAGIPVITITNTNPIITQSSDWYFRVSVIDAYQGVSAAKYAVEYLGCQKAAVFSMEGDDYAKSLIDQFRDEMYELLGNDECVFEIEYKPEVTDFSTHLRMMEIDHCDTVFLPCDAATGEAIMYRAHEMGIDFNWIGCGKWSELIDASAAVPRENNDHLEGASLVEDYDPRADFTETTDAFREAFAALYGDEEPSGAAALGFDAYLLAMNAIRNCRGDLSPENIRKCLSETEQLPGATGYITMDENGDPIKDVVVERIVYNEFRVAYTVRTVRDDEPENGEEQPEDTDDTTEGSEGSGDAEASDTTEGEN